MNEIAHIRFIRPKSDQVYYERLGKVVSREADILLSRLNSSKEELKILDVGSGTGEILKGLSEKGYSPMGVDKQEECALISKEYGKTIVADLMNLDSIYSENMFDLVICSNVLEHLDNPKEGVRILKTISAKWLILIVPNLARLANCFVRKPRYINHGHLMGWDQHHFKTFLEISCGLKIIKWVKDIVALTPLRKTFLLDTMLLNYIEYNLLPSIIPHMTDSMIVVCEK